MTRSRSGSDSFDSLCRFAAIPVISFATPNSLMPIRRSPLNSPEIREGLFETFEQLVEIELCRSRTKVPDNNKLLRCFQYIRMDAVSVGDYCWNGECTNCQIWYEA